MTENTTTPAAATLTLRDVKARARSIATRFATLDRKGSAVTFDAAALFGEASAAGIVGAKPSPMTRSEFGEALGKSAGYVSLLANLSGLQSLGCESTDTLWAYSVQKSGKWLTDALKVDGATLETVRTAQAAHAAGQTAPVVATQDKQNDTGRESGRESAPASESAGVTMPRNNSGILDLIETAMANLSNLTPAEFKRVAEIVEAMGSLTVGASADLADVA
jgi:hypothetical protein